MQPRAEADDGVPKPLCALLRRPSPDPNWDRLPINHPEYGVEVREPTNDAQVLDQMSPENSGTRNDASSLQLSTGGSCQAVQTVNSATLESVTTRPRLYGKPS